MKLLLFVNMAAIQASLPLSHFYQDTLNSSNLSQSVASNELFTPFQLDRITVNPTRSVMYSVYNVLLKYESL